MSGRECRVGFEPEIVRSQPVLELYAYWLKLRGDRRFPSKAEVDIAAIPRLAAHLMLLKVTYEPLDFEYRILGDEIVSRLGNVKGRRVRQAALLNVDSSAYRNYCAVVEAGKPQFMAGWAAIPFRGDEPCLLSRVHCPLSSDGETIDYILSCVAFSFEERAAGGPS
ncbi:MAG TPA: PAS domain-containing protein [Alphaproteobacteria bacterium]|nr:PAS domain-containing protein [Alphaproteobacteria bacterium]